MSSRHVRLQKMRDSLFDGSCVCNGKRLIISATQLFLHTIGQGKVLMHCPLEIIGATSADMRSIIKLLQDIEIEHAYVASMAEVCLRIHQGVGAKLFVVKQPSIDKSGAMEGMETFVGLQICEDSLCSTEWITDANGHPIDLSKVSNSGTSSTSSVSPEDSISHSGDPDPVRRRPQRRLPLDAQTSF